MNGNRRNLVVVRAGDQSLHPEWMKDSSGRTWDILVNYYGDDPHRYREPGVMRIDGKGPKYPALHDLFMSNPRLIADYDYLWLPDDDLMTTATDINRLFHLCAEHRIEVAQPSLTWDSHFSHLITLQNPRSRVRFTNFIEMMAPCISSRTLQKAVPFLNSHLSGWGLDYIWTRLVDDPENGIAIIDAVTVRHTRPVGGPNYDVLRMRGISPLDEMHAFLKANGLPESPSIIAHKVIRLDGLIKSADGRRRRFVFSQLLDLLPVARHISHEPRPLRRLRKLAQKNIRSSLERFS